MQKYRELVPMQRTTHTTKSICYEVKQLTLDCSAATTGADGPLKLTLRAGGAALDTEGGRLTYKRKIRWIRDLNRYYSFLTDRWFQLDRHRALRWCRLCFYLFII